MDTILKPRYLSNTDTESDSSKEDEDTNKKDSSSSSKVTVVPKEGVDQLKAIIVAEAEVDVPTDEDKGGDKKIICPTARFLQVNPKKISSYDLLVRPAKRARFIVHPSREEMSCGGGRATIFKQKINPVTSGSSKLPTVECVYFENEKLRYRKTSSGSWSSSSSSASPRALTTDKAHPKNQSKPKISRIPVPLPRILSEEQTILEIETEQELMRRTGGAPAKSNEHCSAFKDKEFPATKNFAYYAHWTPSFQLIYQEYEKERIRDENKNYLPNNSFKGVLSQGETQELEQVDASLNQTLPHRKILKPVYRLTNINANNESNKQSPRPVTVFLKESDYDSLVELSLFHKDEQSRNKPPPKKMKVDKTEEYIEEDDPSNGGGLTCELLYKMCDNMARESEVIHGGRSVTVEESCTKEIPLSPKQKHVSSLFRSAYHDPSSIHHGTPINVQPQEEFSVIHHPDLREFRTDSSKLEGMGAGNDESPFVSMDARKPDNLENAATDRPFTTYEPSYSPPLTADHDHTMLGNTPFQIFLTESTVLSGPGSGLHFGTGSPLLNFANEEEEEFEESHIVDVTDLIDDEEVTTIISGERSDCGVADEMHTILHARTTTTSTALFQQGLSKSCHLMEELLKRDMQEDVGKTPPLSKNNNLNFQEEFESQEVLMQPNPQLKMSTSVHSTVERGAVHTTTIDNFVQKQTKSDYYVGKVPGLSKSVMKMYHQYSDTGTPVDVNHDKNGNVEQEVITSLEESNCLSPLTSQETPTRHDSSEKKELSGFGKSMENVLRKLSSGNRVKDNGDKLLTPETKDVESLRSAVPLQKSSSSSSFYEPESYKSKRRNLYKEPSTRSVHPIPYEEPPKPILKKEKKPSIIARIIRSLCRGLLKSKRKDSNTSNTASNRKNEERNAFPSVPSHLLRQQRRIVQHTDSKELYKERRRRFFKEQKEFYDESLATYVKSVLMLERQPMQGDCSKAAQNSGAVPTCIPITSFLDKSIIFNRDSVQDACNNNYWGKDKEDDDNVPVPVRLATSESALAGPSCKRHGKSNLVLQFPPFVQVLAAALARRRSLQDSFNGLQKDKEKLKKPLKGILKKT